jgi:hypothetical protein
VAEGRERTQGREEARRRREEGGVWRGEKMEGEEVNIHRGPDRRERNERGGLGFFFFSFPFEAFPPKEEKARERC